MASGAVQLTRDRAWMEQATAMLFADLARLDSPSESSPTLLPGWTRGHLITHLARQAEGLVRLLTWARTGEPSPMYQSRERRNADIESGAHRPLPALLDDLRQTCGALEVAVTTLPDAAWSATVAAFDGRPIPASRVVWIRAREVFVHVVDLDLAATWRDLPPAFVDAVLEEVVEGLSGRERVPSLRLRPSDRDREWSVRGEGDPLTIEGPASELLGWLSGRGEPPSVRPARGDAPPRLPAWL